ncbi:MAG: hypothetical protein ACOX8W_05635 [bacterium]|jgi:hypothetical protein
MRYILQIVGHLREVIPAGNGDITVTRPEPGTIREILAAAGINPDLVMAVLVDGERKKKDFVPPDGATLVCLSALAGG